jgi:hypothetical protein
VEVDVGEGGKSERGMAVGFEGCESVLRGGGDFEEAEQFQKILGFYESSPHYFRSLLPLFEMSCLQI